MQYKFKSLFFFLVLSLILLTGCSTSPKYTELNVTDTKVVQLSIPPSLTEQVYPQKLISQEEYLKLKIYEREQYLTDYIVNLMGNLKQCNVKLEAIKELTP